MDVDSDAALGYPTQDEDEDDVTKDPLSSPYHLVEDEENVDDASDFPAADCREAAPSRLMHAIACLLCPR